MQANAALQALNADLRQATRQAEEAGQTQCLHALKSCFLVTLQSAMVRGLSLPRTCATLNNHAPTAPFTR
jgi:hypothetical protein